VGGGGGGPPPGWPRARRPTDSTSGPCGSRPAAHEVSAWSTTAWPGRAAGVRARRGLRLKTRPAQIRTSHRGRPPSLHLARRPLDDPACCRRPRRVRRRCLRGGRRPVPLLAGDSTAAGHFPRMRNARRCWTRELLGLGLADLGNRSGGTRGSRPPAGRPRPPKRGLPQAREKRSFGAVRLYRARRTG